MKGNTQDGENCFEEHSEEKRWACSHCCFSIFLFMFVIRLRECLSSNAAQFVYMDLERRNFKMNLKSQKITSDLAKIENYLPIAIMS